jgi:hypothetical protein
MESSEHCLFSTALLEGNLDIESLWTLYFLVVIKQIIGFVY